MSKRKIFLLSAMAALLLPLYAEDSVQAVVPPKQKVVNAGVKLQANVSGFIMDVPVAGYETLHSNMNVGAEAGAFIDFNVGKHCLIQFNLLFFSEQCDLINTYDRNKLWTLGVEIPIYVLGRYGNAQRGYVHFGGGPFTEFVVGARMIGGASVRNPYQHVVDVSEAGEQIFAMSDNHSGLGVCVGYEFPCGLQINLCSQASLSNVLNFDGDAYCYPQKISLGLAYRFK